MLATWRAVAVVVARPPGRRSSATSHGPSITGMSVTKLCESAASKFGAMSGWVAVDAGVDDADQDALLARLHRVRPGRGGADLAHVPLPVGQRLGGAARPSPPRGRPSPLPVRLAAARAAARSEVRLLDGLLLDLAGVLGAIPMTRLRATPLTAAIGADRTGQRRRCRAPRRSRSCRCSDATVPPDRGDGAARRGRRPRCSRTARRTPARSPFAARRGSSDARGRRAGCHGCGDDRRTERRKRTPL